MTLRKHSFTGWVALLLTSSLSLRQTLQKNTYWTFILGFENFENANFENSKKKT